VKQKKIVRAEKSVPQQIMDLYKAIEKYGDYDGSRKKQVDKLYASLGVASLSKEELRRRWDELVRTMDEVTHDAPIESVMAGMPNRTGVIKGRIRNLHVKFSVGETIYDTPDNV
jgi:hypothetical protein